MSIDTHHRDLRRQELKDLREQLRRVLAKHPEGLLSREAAQLIGCTSQDASVQLHSMYWRDVVDREPVGRRFWSYTLKAVLT